MQLLGFLVGMQTERYGRLDELVDQIRDDTRETIQAYAVVA
jgi:hypothetical protein